jgi:5,10-methylenetetrahydrofolate reductase
MKPRRLHLDYIAPARRPLWPGLLLLVLSLAVAAALLAGHRDAQLELARLEAAGSLISAERRPPRTVPKERLDEEVKGAEAVVRRLTVPWGSLVQAVEQASTREVAVLQLQPDAENRVVRLTAEARNSEAMFEYLRRLGAAKGLADVHLLSHDLQREDPQRPIQFSVQAALRSTP